MENPKYWKLLEISRDNFPGNNLQGKIVNFQKL